MACVQTLVPSRSEAYSAFKQTFSQHLFHMQAQEARLLLLLFFAQKMSRRLIFFTGPALASMFGTCSVDSSFSNDGL